MTLKKHFTEWAISALVIALVAGFAYLPLANQLGYVHDDWFTVASRLSGISLQQMHSIDRPLLGRVYAFTYNVIGDHPFTWQLFDYLVRVIGALGFLWLLRMLWPEERRLTLFVAVLMVVYPGFLEQISANNYSNHFIGLAIGLWSLAFSIRAVISQNWIEKIVLMALAASAILVYPRIYEALIGLEALRVVTIFYLTHTRAATPFKKGWQNGLLYWLPNLIGIAGFGYWRFFIFKSVRVATDSVGLLQGYLTAPAAAVARIIIESIKDFIESTVLVWAVPFYRLESNATYSALGLALLSALCAGLVFWLYWKAHPEIVHSESSTHGRRKGKTFLACAGLGAVALLIGILPAILSNRDVQFAYNLDRYTLPLTPAIAMLVGGLIFSEIKQWVKPAACLGFLSLAVMTQMLNASAAAASWQAQQSFWWQLTWRAPQLNTGTVLVASLPADERPSEDFEIWAPANLIYHPQTGPLTITAEVLNNDTLPELLAGGQDKRDFRTIQYQRDFSKTLVASLANPSACVHVLGGDFARLAAGNDPLLGEAASASHLEQIDVNANPSQPPADLFGSEPAHGWCYDYQKADLAAQQGNWQEVVNLGEQAFSANLTAQDSAEWLPFLQAYAKMGMTQRVDQIVNILKQNVSFSQRYCVSYGAGQKSGSEIGSILTQHLCQK
jgi:hypothetical protein